MDKEIMTSLYEAIQIHTEGMEIGYMIDAANHGANGGYCGFTWNDDCYKFWNDNYDLIMNFCDEYIQDFGHKNWLELFNSFNDPGGIMGNRDGFKILGSWFILEEVGRWVSELDEDELSKLNSFYELEKVLY